MIYDFIILGGGISGLYSAYKLHAKYPRKTILILEKNEFLGGRVYTFSNKYMTVDAGAGRFSHSHILLMNLIKDLGLTSKIVPITSSAVYAPADGTSSMFNSILDAPMLTGDKKTVYNIENIENIGYSLLDIALGKDNIPSAGLLVRVILASKLESKENLINISFIDYAKKILEPPEVQLILDSFGYYSELIIMNAYDAIQLMDNLSPQNQFYVLNGGLSQIIERLMKRLDNKYISIYTHKTVVDIDVMDDSIFSVNVLENKRAYKGHVCISTLPKQSLEKLPIFRGFRSVFKNILCAPLCRIYSKFPVIDGKTWFSGFPKFTTNNNLRMVLPISEKDGIIMISYTDNKFADYWKKVLDKYGISGVNKRIARLMKESIGIDIPEAIDTQVFYWGCGVGYWGVGADSHAISTYITRPIDDLNLFICGEHFSEKNQQWMEGGLETSEKVIGYL